MIRWYVYNFLKIIALFMLIAIGSNPAIANDHGISIREFGNLINKTPDSKANIESILVFTPENRVAILFSSLTRGWGIWVYQRLDSKRWKLEWESPKLDGSFSVSSPDRFKLANLPTGERCIQFSGCAAHNCSDIYSVMLYVPSKGRAYTCFHRLDGVGYSFSSESNDEQMYKEYLKEQVKH